MKNTLKLGFLVAVVVIVLGVLYSLDKYDEYQAEKQAAAALEPRLEVPPPADFPSAFHPSPAVSLAPALGFTDSAKQARPEPLCRYDVERREVSVYLKDGRMARVDRETGKVRIE